MKQVTPYRDFDLPKHHLGPSGDYIPPKARRPEEIERRRSLRPGELLLEQQTKGIKMAGFILGRLGDVETPSQYYAADMLSMSTLNTAWYTYARQATVMRRRLKLPVMATDDPEWHQTATGLRDIATVQLQEAAARSEGLHMVGSETQRARETVRLGQLLGTASLHLSGTRLTLSPRIGAFEAQDAARSLSLEMMSGSRDALRFGAATSLAQLADADSPLNVYWRRTAPNEAFELHEQAFEEIR